MTGVCTCPGGICLSCVLFELAHPSASWKAAARLTAFSRAAVFPGAPAVTSCQPAEAGVPA
jgi:hypothetical protein